MSAGNAGETGVKFAGDDNKAKIYEPKQHKKIIRLMTVMAYVFSVSLAAIMLSLYYIFLWDPQSHKTGKALKTRANITSMCPPQLSADGSAKFSEIALMPDEMSAIGDLESTRLPPPPSSDGAQLSSDDNKRSQTLAETKTTTTPNDANRKQPFTVLNAHNSGDKNPSAQSG